MPKEYEAVPGSKPKRQIKWYRPNNPSLASHSVKMLFGQETQELANSQINEYQTRRLPFSLPNPESKQSIYKTSLNAYNENNSKQLLDNTLSSGKNDVLNVPPSEEKLESARSVSLSKPSSKQPVFDKALNEAQNQFNAQKDLASLGRQQRNSLNQLLYEQREPKEIGLGQRRNSSGQLNTYNYMNYGAIKTKQNHGYNIISGFPSYG